MRQLILLVIPATACAAQLEVLSLLSWQRLPVGDRAMAEGGAVVARINGPSAGYGNPAGLADLAMPTVSGTVDVLEYTRVASRTPGGTAATADDVGLKPNLVGFANALEGGAGGWAFTLASPLTWSSGLEVRTDTSTGSRRDDGRSTLEMTAVGLTWGRRLAPSLCAGLGLEAWLTDYRFDTGTSAQDATSVLTATYTERGRQTALRGVFGVQWAGDGWQLGGLLRTPGLLLLGQGSISGSSTSGNGTTTRQTDISDDDAAFAVPLPWQLVIGAAWMPAAIPGLELEADLDIHAGSDAEDVFGQAAGLSISMTGAVRTVQGVSQAARTVDLRPVVNPRFGLRYRFPGTLFDRTIYGHLGGYIERSPVDSSEVFSQLDLLGGTAGVSFEKGPMQVTIAAAYVTSGTVQDALGYVSSPGSGINPELDDTDASYAVRTFSMSLGSSYRF